MNSHDINIEGEVLRLRADGSIFWPSRKALFIADFHLGKANHFRKAGIAVPIKVHQQNLKRLERSLQDTEATDVYFLGDLFHSEHNTSWESFLKMIKEHRSVTHHLILGNHDIMPANIYKASALHIHDEGLVLEPFILNHHPSQEVDQMFCLCGHIHPAVRLSGKGRQSVKLSCFWKSDHQLVLPAFGGFTGNATVKPSPEDEIYILVNGKIKIV